MIKLKTSKRNKDISSEEIREQGLIPAVIYGPKQESISISVNGIDFEKVYKEAGESTLVSLDIDGEDHDVLIHDIQFNPIKSTPIHVDFYAVERGKKLQVPVKLEFIGVSPAEKNLGGLVVKVLHEVEVECLPRDLPSHLNVNLEKLVDLESQIHAKDIELPEGVELVTEADEVVVLIKEAKEETEESATLDLESIEVEKKGKQEEKTEE